MTADEKSLLSDFLYTAGDYLRSGFSADREAYSFTDDLEPPLNEGENVSGASAPDSSSFSSIPLAYQIPEDEEANTDDTFETIVADIEACTACALCEERIKAVPGEGVTNPLVLIVGEGPGAEEDASGRPFVGKAGQLLDKMLASIGLSREKNCYIANTVKCRPPNNREPDSNEMEACADYLDRQIRLLKPLVILCLGRTAVRRILKSEESIKNLHGRFSEYLSVPVLPTYHPSALLRDESYKRPAWEDLKMLKSKLVSMSKEYAVAVGDM